MKKKYVIYYNRFNTGLHIALLMCAGYMLINNIALNAMLLLIIPLVSNGIGWILNDTIKTN